MCLTPDIASDDEHVISDESKLVVFGEFPFRFQFLPGRSLQTVLYLSDPSGDLFPGECLYDGIVINYLIFFLADFRIHFRYLLYKWILLTLVGQ